MKRKRNKKPVQKEKNEKNEKMRKAGARGGTRRVGPRGRKGWGSEGNLEKVRARRVGPRRWEAQNFAHDSPRAQTRTFKGRPSKTPPKFHEKTSRERKSENGSGRKCARLGSRAVVREILGGTAVGRRRVLRWGGGNFKKLLKI